MAQLSGYKRESPIERNISKHKCMFVFLMFQRVHNITRLFRGHSSNAVIDPHRKTYRYTHTNTHISTQHTVMAVRGPW